MVNCYPNLLRIDHPVGRSASHCGRQLDRGGRPKGPVWTVGGGSSSLFFLHVLFLFFLILPLYLWLQNLECTPSWSSISNMGQEAGAPSIPTLDLGFGRQRLTLIYVRVDARVISAGEFRWPFIHLALGLSRYKVCQIFSKQTSLLVALSDAFFR